MVGEKVGKFFFLDSKQLWYLYLIVSTTLIFAVLNSQDNVTYKCVFYLCLIALNCVVMEWNSSNVILVAFLYTYYDFS